MRAPHSGFWRRASRPLVVGHRGVRGADVAENTPAAFAAAVEQGADAVELDARRTADGAVVLSHDATTAEGLVVVESTAAQLAAVGLCTLAEGLASIPPGVGVNVELKNLPFDPDYTEDESLVSMVAPIVRRFRDSHPLLLTSFNPFTVAALVAQLPDLPVGFISAASVDVATAIVVAQEQNAGYLACQIGSPGLTDEGVAAAHDANLGVMVWATGAIDELVDAARLGVDALCVDEPARVRAALSGP